MTDDASFDPAAELGLLDGLATTRAIRRLRPDPIPETDLSTMLWHATRAPSGTNRQPTRWVVLRNTPETATARGIIAEGFADGWGTKADDANYRSGSALDPETRKGRQMAAMEHLVANVEHAPVIIIPVLLRHRPPNPLEGASVYPAVQNLLLAARALGYGGVLTGWHRSVEDRLAAELGLPDNAAIMGIVPLGRPEGQHGPVRRLPLADVVFDGRWDVSADWATDPEGTRFAGPPPTTSAPRSTPEARSEKRSGRPPSG